jgi:hypothetical protein
MTNDQINDNIDISPAVELILRHMGLVYILRYSFFKIYFNIILPSTHR